MSAGEKVKRVAETKAEFGLNRSLMVIDLPKSTWYYRTKQQVAYEAKYAHLRPDLEYVARTWPEYGYRRTTTALRRERGHEVNQKVVRKLHQSWDLALIRQTRQPKPSQIRRIIRKAGNRANLIADLETIELLEVFYTDFTELVYANGKAKAYFMPILDHASRYCLGWALGDQANRTLALEAWKQAKQQLAEWGRDPAECILHQDQDSVYTSYDWTGQLLLEDQAKLSYALAGAKDNPHMESFFSRFKAEGHSLILQAGTMDELQAVIEQRVRFYNQVRYHSSLGDRPPLEWIQDRHPDWDPVHI